MVSPASTFLFFRVFVSEAPGRIIIIIKKEGSHEANGVCTFSFPSLCLYHVVILIFVRYSNIYLYNMNMYSMMTKMNQASSFSSFWAVGGSPKRK